VDERERGRIEKDSIKRELDEERKKGRQMKRERERDNEIVSEREDRIEKDRKKD
jgi:hypothetical protein